MFLKRFFYFSSHLCAQSALFLFSVQTTGNKFSFTNLPKYFFKVLFKMGLVEFCTKSFHFTLQGFRNNSDLV